jgi:glutamine synthetase
MPALRTADQVVIYKHVAKRLARRHGWTPVFLPKPLADGGAAGMPQHHALWRAGTNLFHDDAGWALTSPAGLAYAAGILRHAPALLAFCAPTTNSYRRLIPGTQAPTELILSKHRITALCRVPAGSTGPNPAARRVKFCGSDSSANPYFALASTLMAGLDGIEQALTPPLEHAEESFPRRLPHSLEETLTELERDNAFLLKGGVFTAETLRAWIDEVWKLQVLPVRSRPHPWELRLEEDR